MKAFPTNCNLLNFRSYSVRVCFNNFTPLNDDNVVYLNGNGFVRIGFDNHSFKLKLEIFGNVTWTDWMEFKKKLTLKIKYLWKQF